MSVCTFLNSEIKKKRKRFFLTPGLLPSYLLTVVHVCACAWMCFNSDPAPATFKEGRHSGLTVLQQVITYGRTISYYTGHLRHPPHPAHTHTHPGGFSYFGEFNRAQGLFFRCNRLKNMCSAH